MNDKITIKKATPEDLNYIQEHKEDFVLLAGSWDNEPEDIEVSEEVFNSITRRLEKE